MAYITHILWDLHETLLPWPGAIKNEFYRNCARYWKGQSGFSGEQLSRSFNSYLKRRRRKTVSDAFRQIGLTDRVQRAIDEIKIDYFRKHIPEDKELVDSVNYFKDLGIKNYVITNDSLERTTALLDVLGFSGNEFENLFTPDRLGYKKPTDEWWAEVKSHLSESCQMDKSCKSVLYVDNNDYCIDMASRHKFTTVLVSPSDFYYLIPDHQIRNAKDLAKLYREKFPQVKQNPATKP